MVGEKSCIRETKHLSTDADSSTDTKKILLVRKNRKKLLKKKCAAILYPFWAKCSNLRPLLSIAFPQGFWKSKKFGHWTSGNGGKRPLNGVRNTDTKKSCSVRQNLPKNKLFLTRHFYTFFLLTVFKSETISFHYFSPKIPNL